MTIDTIKETFDGCNTIEEMENLLSEFLDSDVDTDDTETKELISELRAQINDRKLDYVTERNETCTRWIESGMCQLYLCNSDTDKYKAGDRYYVRIDDVKTDTLNRLKDIMDRLDPEVLNRVNSMDPIIYIISDDGIGTPSDYKTIDYNLFVENFVVC
jgi:hypothetical protein